MTMPWETKPLDRTETKVPGVPNFLVREQCCPRGCRYTPCRAARVSPSNEQDEKSKQDFPWQSVP